MLKGCVINTVTHATFDHVFASRVCSFILVPNIKILHLPLSQLLPLHHQLSLHSS